MGNFEKEVLYEHNIRLSKVTSLGALEGFKIL